MGKGSDQRLIIGVGTGRCGTVSFSNLLKKQCIPSTHEEARLPWEYDQFLIDNTIDRLLERDSLVVADTAFYYLPYIEYIIKQLPDTKVVCLRRPIEETVDSYMKKTEGRNHWFSDDESEEDSKWDVCYPSYDMTNKRNAIRRYWREYHHKVISLQTEYPNNVKIFNYDTLLNTKRGQDEMFSFVGIRGYINHLDIVMNKSNI